jgi:hypothetical protein
MSTIYEFPLPKGMGAHQIQLKGGRFIRPLSIGLDGDGLPCLWADVALGHGLNDNLVVYLAWTGWTVPADWSFLGSLVYNGLVNHIYIETPEHAHDKMELQLMDRISNAISEANADLRGMTYDELAIFIVKELREEGTFDD